MTLDVISLPDLSATEQAARRIAPLLKRGDVLGLQGPLGAGKTVFARYLLQALGVAEDVPSPTFTLLQTYETPKLSIYHFDLYRLEKEDELEELGWDDAPAEGLVIVEWPEHAPGSMPEDRLVLHFTLDDKGMRTLAFEPGGAWVKRLEGMT